MRRIREVSLLERLAADDPPLVLDVRSGWEYRRGRIPGAVHMPFWRVPWRRAELARMAPNGLVIYCGHGPRAYIAGLALQGAGGAEIRYLRGHMSRWLRRRLPIQR